jgi:hypothetical protein
LDEYDLKTVGHIYVRHGVERSIEAIRRARFITDARPGQTGIAFHGTCFAFGSAGHYLTAAHCVRTIDPKDLAVAFPNRAIGFISRVVAHPTADVACVTLETPESCPWGPVPALSSAARIGTDFFCFGYPSLEYGNMRDNPTVRLVKGHIQRFFEHRNTFGYQFRAAELSVACPPGMSGSPIIRRDVPFELLGLVTDFVEAGTISRSEEVETVDGQTSVTVYRDVLRYGVGLVLGDHAEWLKANSAAG